MMFDVDEERLEVRAQLLKDSTGASLARLGTR